MEFLPNSKDIGGTVPTVFIALIDVLKKHIDEEDQASHILHIEPRRYAANLTISGTQVFFHGFPSFRLYNNNKSGETRQLSLGFACE